ncbi:MAG: hypothetical protein NZ853_03490 [Leptospiraceae bacterium]|nr:hypothetical protein [Leptospiraceae bacterium]MDW7975237.1 hypothetical protein [Leptospiraceae bacterium]
MQNGKFFLLVIILFFHNCKSYIVINSEILYSTITLTDSKIQFQVPSHWEIFFSSKRFFHFYGKDPNQVYGPMMEYRGLPNPTKTKTEREQYASGWYKAINLNYKNWNYIEKNYIEIEFNNKKIYSYQFLGSFDDGQVKVKKLGFLRFFDDRIHAIYYTCEDFTFTQCMDTFMKIDNSINYEPKIPTY